MEKMKKEEDFVSKKQHEIVLRELEFNKQLLKEESRAKGMLRSEVEQLEYAVSELNARILNQIRQQEDRISQDKIIFDENLKEEELRQCVTELRIQLKAEKERSERLQNQLIETGQELEEVTRSLFEEANEMVSNEARRRAGAEDELNRLRIKMEEMERRCEMESIQNQNLKERLRNSKFPLDKNSKELSSNPSLNSIHSSDSAQIKRKLYKNVLEPRRTSSTPSFDIHSNLINQDGENNEGNGCEAEREEQNNNNTQEEKEEISIPTDFPSSTLHEFAEFIADGNGEELLSGALGEKIMEAEISPTLRFFCNKKNYSKLLNPRSGVYYLSSWRNLEKSLAENRCYIESIGNVKEKHTCSGCERRESLFKMRIQIPTHLIFNPNDSYSWSDWKYICSTCRDRLVSVGDLYSFLRNAKSGVLKKDLPSLYRQFVKLRIRISASRVLTL
eukprot:TRINITY_DN4035_c0_g1_i1.p1 TRINITY_DN4035_c0_g1~~TRINITY_DN4035_c0_g1_i1.p1  ORF type:complete len:447 (+),score=202.69 TRINITY_DN4035_c0_g1_i1:155-1495(+)